MCILLNAWPHSVHTYFSPVWILSWFWRCCFFLNLASQNWQGYGRSTVSSNPVTLAVVGFSDALKSLLTVALIGFKDNWDLIISVRLPVAASTRAWYMPPAAAAAVSTLKKFEVKWESSPRIVAGARSGSLFKSRLVPSKESPPLCKRPTPAL